MKKTLLPVFAFAVLIGAQPAAADRVSEKLAAMEQMQWRLAPGPVEKAASTRTTGARGFTTNTTPMYGGTELNASAVVYILVRGNSLGSLGVTQAYLDFPRAIVYDANNHSIFDVAGYPGFNGCFENIPQDKLIRDYYAARGIPVSEDDACLAVQAPVGPFTFKVVPSVAGVTATFSSVPQAGEVLFEVKIAP